MRFAIRSLVWAISAVAIGAVAGPERAGAEEAPADSLAPGSTAPEPGAAPGSGGKIPGAPTQPLPDSLRAGEGIPVPLWKTRISAYPYAYYTPETEFAIGAGGIVTFYTAQEKGLRPSKMVLSAYYSTKDQYKITLSPDLYFNANRLFTGLDLDYGRYVDRFYGIGSSAADIDSSEYVLRGWGLKLEAQLPPALSLFHRTRSGWTYEIKHREISETRGNPNLETDFPPAGIDGGLTSGLGWIWSWDTRDHIFYPTRGVFTQLSGVYYMKAIGSDYDFNRYKLDLRNYHALGKKSVFAIQVLGHWVGGTAPFYELPALGGGQMLRGYYEGRYRDRFYMAGQLELRRQLFWRLGAAAFVGLGDIAHEFNDFRIRTSQVSGGLGLRVLFNEAENVNLRVDVGVGKNTSGVYFGLEEAF